MPKTTMVMIECDFCHRSCNEDDCQETKSGIVICEGCFDQVIELSYVHYQDNT
jgi:hypothetical protein